MADIKCKRAKPGAKLPVFDEKHSWFEVFAAEDVFISPNEIKDVRTGTIFIFPNEIGLMFMPISEMRTKASITYANNVFVKENSYYFQDELKIKLKNTYSPEDDGEKVYEYKLLDGTIIKDQNHLYVKGTVKICSGDCISHMMEVTAACNNPEIYKKINNDKRRTKHKNPTKKGSLEKSSQNRHNPVTKPEQHKKKTIESQ